MKKYRMMTLILRDIGKIPFARTVYDKTEWLNDTFMKTSRHETIFYFSLLHRYCFISE